MTKEKMMTTPRSSRRLLFRGGIGLLLLAGLAAGLARFVPRAGADAAAVPGVVIIGFDGMDWEITNQMLSAGELPTLARLRGQGCMLPIYSSNPPQSPVAWSNFITGQNPGGHGIYDFIARDPQTYLPYLSTSVTKAGGREIAVGDWVFPLQSGGVELEREGKSFWEMLVERGVPCSIQRIPSNFPPVECEARSLAGMGTPDILGTYGTFSYFTTEPGQVGEEQGGRVYEVEDVDYVVEAALPGPPNPFRKGNPPSSAPFTATIDPTHPMARIVMDGQEALLQVGEWSDWMRVTYRLAPWSQVHGICRFLLREVRPDFKLYVTPVNLDPLRPALPISTPPGFARELAEAIGFYYTQGIAEDTWALEEGRLNEREYLEQSDFVLAEHANMLKYELDHYRGGFLFFYVSTTDLTQHMFWRATDPASPSYTGEIAAAYSDVIRQVYREADRTLNYALSRLPENTVVFAISDHGFGAFRHTVNINTWLRQEGYLRYQDDSPGEKGEFLQGVDWSRSRAYALGLNGVYLNLRGREGQGIVSPGAEAEALAKEISAKLEALVDPATGEHPIHHAYLAREEYSGPYVDRAPDIVPGYWHGYRASWETALGKTPVALFGVNQKKWSGDHCGDFAVVPGILACNRRLQGEEAYLYDLAPTILALYGLKPLPEMVGRVLVEGGPTAARAARAGREG